MCGGLNTAPVRRTGASAGSPLAVGRCRRPSWRRRDIQPHAKRKYDYIDMDNLETYSFLFDTFETLTPSLTELKSIKIKLVINEIYHGLNDPD